MTCGFTGHRCHFNSENSIGVGGGGASAGDVSAGPARAVHLGTELTLQLHETPHLGAVRADARLDVGSRPADGC
jgi:hypothetical protein